MNLYNKKRINIKNIFIPKIKCENDNFYDVIIKMNSLNELLIDGWEICYAKENYEKFKNQYLIPIGIIGESNTGKSFLLGRIFNIELPEGFSQKTEGISIKYLFTDQLSYALIDTFGLRKPITKDNKNKKYFKQLIKDILIKEEEKKMKNKNEREFEMKIKEIKEKEINIDDIKIKNENIFYKCLKKFISDKQMVEKFIRNFVLKKSKIFLIVVGELSISEQLLINNIKEDEENENEEIIIIHNLFNFVKIKQVKDYINDVLKKSIYFNLDERFIVEIENENTNKDCNKTIFIENYYNENTEKSIVIRHLIFANDSKESEAGNYYNYSTIIFLRNILSSINNLIKFDVFRELKEFLINESFKYFELNEELIKKIDENDEYNEHPIKEKEIIFEEKKNNIDENNKIIQIENKITQKNNETKKTILMKIKENSNLKLKELEPEDNIKYFRNVFIPKYKYYTEFVNENFLEKKNKYENKKNDNKIEVLVIDIELAGEIKDFHQEIKFQWPKYYFFITGIKKLLKNDKMFYYYSDIKENEFRIEFEININKLELQTTKLKKYIFKNEILKLYYKIKSKQNDEINYILIKNVNKNKIKNNDEEKKEGKKEKNKNNE